MLLAQFTHPKCAILMGKATIHCKSISEEYDHYLKLFRSL